ncbi:MAG: flagellar motor switch protein FliG [Myxococcales bacterium]|nr:flagellar motor switch protein FliG [Myxococcales bacterium]
MSAIQFEMLTGAEKAAILMLAMGPDRVAELLAKMEDHEVERILASVSRFDEIAATILDRVLQEFIDAIGHHELNIHGGRERALNLISETLEGERAKRLKEKLGRDEKRIDWTLRGYSSDFIANELKDEHPQTIAVILAQLSSERGAQIIKELPDGVQSDVLLRIAGLEVVDSGVVFKLEEEIAIMFHRELGAPTPLGGTDAAAKILNGVPKSDGQTILEGVDTRDPDIAGEIRKRMLTFNDLSSIDKRGFQSLLREVPTEDLVIALKTASDEMKEQVFSNVSSRAADQIREESELLPPMKLSEIEAIQLGIVDIARRLEEEGTLTIDAGGGGDDVLV